MRYKLSEQEQRVLRLVSHGQSAYAEVFGEHGCRGRNYTLNRLLRRSLIRPVPKLTGFFTLTDEGKNLLQNKRKQFGGVS